MPAPPCGNYGDVDDDGVVTIADAELVQAFVLGSVTPTEEQKKRADVDGDGKVTQADYMYIRGFAMGSITTFPVCSSTTSCPWDLNGDGVVDDADVLWLQDHWGACTPGSKGDFNGDGTIDLDDIMILQAHYGPCPSAEHAISFIVPTGATLKVDEVEII